MTREDIAERLAAADEDVSDQQLTEILQRLVDCGQLLQAQRQLGFPMSYVVSDRWDYVAGRWDYDAVDDLGASICAVLRGRDEIGYTDDEQLKGWLSEAGVTDFDDRQLGWRSGTCSVWAVCRPRGLISGSVRRLVRPGSTSPGFISDEHRLPSLRPTARSKGCL